MSHMCLRSNHCISVASLCQLFLTRMACTSGEDTQNAPPPPALSPPSQLTIKNPLISMKDTRCSRCAHLAVFHSMTANLTNNWVYSHPQEVIIGHLTKYR
ncbi:hypothetical protein K469DRAFT_306657 [Zopfia rhizophila CBS 207.26]|uniref:Secreted protein n=1 Tax=Zopfia rhizophila CBS 207.26 TaxID=1314779 RepID=A0A6A6EPZ8_9PEZI|nr:hypothetical protein K469DRAFT_306657 [Zopfia rhizophila CBS 207.26]